MNGVTDFIFTKVSSDGTWPQLSGNFLYDINNQLKVEQHKLTVSLFLACFSNLVIERLFSLKNEMVSKSEIQNSIMADTTRTISNNNNEKSDYYRGLDNALRLLKGSR